MNNSDSIHTAERSSSEDVALEGEALEDEAPEDETSETGAYGEKAPSFSATFNSVDALLQAKLKKYSALKSLFIAEAQLSLGAIAVVAAIGVAMFVVLLTTWMLVNAALGIIIYYFINIAIVSAVTLIFINLVCGFLLYRYLHKVSESIGIPKTSHALSRV